MQRRDFLTLAGGALLCTGSFLRADGVSAAATAKSEPVAPKPGTEPKRPSAFEIDLVREFVVAGHRNLPRVKELLVQHPRLVVASYDWGAGDFETGLGGASHLGNRDLALYLLEAGARIDAFCAAMLGETEMVKALLRLSPQSASTAGPHGYTLLYHAGYSGKLEIGRAVAAALPSGSAKHFNQALQSAVAGKHGELATWLLASGVDDPNTKYFDGRTPLDVALATGQADVAKAIHDAGGRSAKGLIGP